MTRLWILLSIVWNVSPFVLKSSSAFTSRLFSSSNSRQQHVPLIGPIPGGQPLLVGGEVMLDPPTPLQWQSLQESVILHRQYLDKTESAVTGIDAAPLVAFIDDFTGTGTTGRYATLAAVMGMSFKSQDDDTCSIDNSEDFMESLLRMKSRSLPVNSCIRLVGVGRATLQEFFYKMAHEEDDSEEDVHELLEELPPIVMAEFSVKRDSDIWALADGGRLGEKGARSVHSSPVHALAEMNRQANRIAYLHEDRRRLVQGLKTAKARLEQQNVFEDHDGIGQATTASTNEQAIIEDFLTSYRQSKHLLPWIDPTVVSSLENYGLSYYSSLSSLTQLSTVALEVLGPYYSPKIQQSEEYEFEVKSFVAFRALQGFCTPQDMAWALECTNTIERLQVAYDIMLRHKQLLEKMAQHASHDLLECGEECTDLW